MNEGDEHVTAQAEPGQIPVAAHLEIALTTEGKLLVKGVGPMALTLGMLEMAKARLLRQWAAEEQRSRIVVPQPVLGEGPLRQ